MEIKRILVVYLFSALYLPQVSTALEVDINGKALTPKIQGHPCIEIAGDYPGFKIISSEAGKIPQICFNHNQQNHLEIHHVTFEATRQPSAGEGKERPTTDVRVTFTHTFPPGPNGVVTARANLFGFFSTATGVGSPIGDQVHFNAYFSQQGNFDQIAAPFVHSVGDSLESGVFKFGAKKKYLVSGPRLLKGELQFSFARNGDKLTLPLATGVKVDRGVQYEDRLDALEAELSQKGK